MRARRPWQQGFTGARAGTLPEVASPKNARRRGDARDVPSVQVKEDAGGVCLYKASCVGTCYFLRMSLPKWCPTLENGSATCL